MAKRQQPEFRLHCVVADFLRVALSPEVLWFAIPNGEKRSKITGARLKRMGVRPGVADLMISWHVGGQIRVLWCELKALKGGSLSPEQRRFRFDAENTGHDFYVCHSLSEVESVLRSCGCPLKARVAA